MPDASERLRLLREVQVHPAAQVFPLLGDQEFALLVEDVRKNGQLVPILRFNGKILDGRNRYLAAKLAGLTPSFTDIDLDGKSAMEWVITLNLRRRQITKSQAAAAAVLALPSYEAEARKRQIAALKRGRSKPKSRPAGQGRSDAVVARLFSVSSRYINDARRLQRSTPSLFEALLSGTCTLAQAKRAARAQAAKTRKEATLQLLPQPPQCTTICGDFRQSRIEPSSADLILTDPPYCRADLPLWTALATQAQRVLRPGGFLVALCGLYFLPEVMAAFAEKGLDYYWTVCLRLTGPNGRRCDKNLATGWRPALIWAKPPVKRPPEFFIDVVATDGTDTTHHQWGQKRSCFDYFVTHFSRPGDLVYDPMCGGGTVLESCQALGRRCVGIERDPTAVARARKRLGLPPISPEPLQV